MTNEQLWAESERRLSELAYRAMSVRHMEPGTFMVVCIEVDSELRWLVDMIMPDNEGMWQRLRDDGAAPFARGSVHWDFMKDVLEGIAPDAAQKLFSLDFPKNLVPAILMANGRTDVYLVEPQMEFSDESARVPN